MAKPPLKTCKLRAATTPPRSEETNDSGNVTNPAESANSPPAPANRLAMNRVLRMTLSPLQAVRFKAFLDQSKKQDAAVGLLATIAPRFDITIGETILELRIGAFSRGTAAKVQRLLREEIATKEGS